METPKKEISHHLQVWVTSIGLIVGFICGLAVSTFGYRPSLEDLHGKLDQVRRLLDEDQRVINMLAKQDPAAFERLVSKLPPVSRTRFEAFLRSADHSANPAPAPVPPAKAR
jgi:hypothetical protein